MSVFITLKASGNPQALEQYGKDNAAKMQDVLEAAKRHGVIAHRFYGSEDGGNVLVLDEWPDRQSFEAFFAEKQADIGSILQAAGVTDQVAPDYWQELHTGDAYGWGA